MAGMQRRRGEFEQGDIEVADSGHRDGTSVADINRQLDTRKAKFHPQKADIVSSDFQPLSIVDKVVAALACDCGSNRAEEAQQEGIRAPIEVFEGVSTQHNQGRYGADVVEDPEATSIVDEAPGLSEEVKEEGSKASEESMAQVHGTQDESSRHSPFEKIKEKLREKQEQMQLKGEKGIEDDPHPELTFVREEPNFDYKVPAQDGAEEHRNPLEKLKDKLNHKQEELKLRGEKGVEEDPHPELAHVNIEPNPDYVINEEQQEFAAAPLPFQPTQEKSVEEKEFVDAPPAHVNIEPNPDCVINEERQEFADIPLPFQPTQEKSAEEKEFVDAPLAHVHVEPNPDYVINEDQQEFLNVPLPFQPTQEKSVEEKEFVDAPLAHVNIEPNPDYVINEEQQEFADAPLSFQPTQEKSVEEKEFVDAPLSFQQDEKNSDGRAICDVTPPEVEESNSGYATNNPIAEEASSGKLEREGSSSSSSSEEEGIPGSFEKTQEKSSDEEVAGDNSNSVVEDESQPGFFSKVKQSLWKTAASDRKNQEGHKDDDSELEKHESSSSSSVDNEPVPTSQQAHEQSNDEKAGNTGSSVLEDESKPSFLSKFKQTLWKSDSKNDKDDKRDEDDDVYTEELDKQSSLSPVPSEKKPSPTFQQAGDQTAVEEGSDIVSPNEADSKPSLFSKVKQTLWKSDSKSRGAEPAGDVSKDEGNTRKGLERKGSSSSDEEVDAANPPLDRSPTDAECEEVLGEQLVNTLSKDAADVPVHGEETTVIPSVSIAWDEDDVKSPAKLPDKEESDIGKALQDKLHLDKEPEDVGTEHAESESTEKLEEEPSFDLQNKMGTKSGRHSSIGEEKGSGFLGRIATKIGFSTSPTTHGRSQST